MALDGFCESIDVAPTLLDFLGVEIPDRFQGQSCLGRIRGAREAEARTEIHYEFDYRNRVTRQECPDPDACLFWVLRDEAFKYVQFADGELPPLLFDLKEDPGEYTNLVGDAAYAPVVARYAQRLLQWRMKAEDQRMEHWASRYR